MVLEQQLKPTLLLCAQMDPSGFGKGWGNVPKMQGTWPASTWASSPSSASWFPLFRKSLRDCLFIPFKKNNKSSDVCNSQFLFISRQCYSSFKTGNMDQALSIWFLLLWLGGDSCNLIGSFLANQLPLQVMRELVF